LRTGRPRSGKELFLRDDSLISWIVLEGPPTMKILFVSLILFPLAAVFAQDIQKNATPPGVAIRKCKWEKVGPAPVVDSAMKAESDSPTGGTSDPNVPAQASGVRERDNQFYVYSVELQNDGAKPIKAVLWDYIITDSSTNEELGRHNFVSFDRVGRNSARALKVKSRVSPSRIVTVQDSPPPGNSTVVDRVILRCVVYDDGTVWEQPGTNQNCEALQKWANK
jgi:hypothetical protein